MNISSQCDSSMQWSGPSLVQQNNKTYIKLENGVFKKSMKNGRPFLFTTKFMTCEISYVWKCKNDYFLRLGDSSKSIK